MSAFGVNNASDDRTREVDQCQQVAKIQRERCDMVSASERRVRAKVAIPTTIPTFAVATNDAPSLVLLDFDALKLVCAQVHKDHRYPMRLACRALRDACPEATLKEKNALCYRVLVQDTTPIHTITPTRALCTSVSLFTWAIDPKGGGMFGRARHTKHVGRAVAAAGNVDVMRHLTKECPWFCKLDDWDEHTCEAAAAHGHLEMLQYLREPRNIGGGQAHQCPWSVTVMSSAAQNGDLDMLQWAYYNGLLPSAYTVAVACQGGHDRVVAWLLDLPGGTGLADEYSSFWAAHRGHLRCLEALWLRGHAMDNRCCYAAAGAGHLDCLRWLRNVAHAHWDYKTCNHAAGCNQVECLRWALENGCTCLHEASRSAVARGSVECVKLLMEFDKFRPSDWECCTLAAEMGHLEMLKWLRANGGQWHESLAYQMVCIAHPHGRTPTRPCVHWARANGYDSTVPGVDVEYLVILDEMYKEDRDEHDELCGLRDKFKWMYGQNVAGFS